MAKKKSGRRDEASGRGEAAAPTAKPASSAGLAGLVTVLAVLLGGGTYVNWHRKKDPARIWAHAVETKHAEKIERQLTLCFGGTDATAVRRVMDDVRHGVLHPPFQNCSDTRLAELLATPMDFAADLRNPPGAAESAQLRERAKLLRLRGSYTNLERAVAGLNRSQPIPDAQRERIATALEDVAVDVDAERTSFNDLMIAAENGASWW